MYHMLLSDNLSPILFKVGPFIPIQSPRALNGLSSGFNMVSTDNPRHKTTSCLVGQNHSELSSKTMEETKTKMEWKKKETKNKKRLASTVSQNLPFDNKDEEEEEVSITTQKGRKPSTEQQYKTLESSSSSSCQNPVLDLAQVFQSEGNKLAEDGRYKEALGKWEAALTLIPDKAVLHEQKAQVLLEIGDAWNALKAATRATELEPSWAEAWITLARTQLNYGEPDAAIESFDRALAIKPDSKEAQGDRQTAMHLVKRRKQLHLSGLSATENRFIVGDLQSS